MTTSTKSEDVEALARHCVRGGIANEDRILVHDTLRALCKERDALREALTSLEKAAENYHNAASGYFLDSDYDGDGNLALADALLAIEALPAARAALESNQ